MNGAARIFEGGTTVIRRAASASWHTPDLHRLWELTPAQAFAAHQVSLHTFLDYCRVLQDVRTEFLKDQSESPFDSILFFLRGGYFAFCYLNITEMLLERAQIFGGLSHGERPAQVLEQWILARAKNATGKRIRLLIIDEVNSGTGISRILKVFKQCLLNSAVDNEIGWNLKVYAIRPQPEMSSELGRVVAKWAKPHQRRRSTLTVTIKHFAGSLLGYDNDVMCGIRRTSHGSSFSESYDMVRLNEGTLEFICERSGTLVTTALLHRGSLVEFLAECARSLTIKSSGAIVDTFVADTEHHGCDECKLLLQLVRDRSSTLGLPTR